MRTSKKIIAGVSAFIVAVSSIAITVSAVTTDSTDFTVSVSSAKESVSAGEEVQLTVDLSNVPETGIAGFEFAVNFDSSAFELVDVIENTEVVGSANDKELELVPDLKDTMVNDGSDYSCFDYYVNGDKIACMWATGLEDSAYWIGTDGTLVTFTFTAKQDISIESVDLGIVPIHDDGEVVFAAADESGKYYAYDGVQLGEDVTINIDGGEDNPDVTTTDDGGDDPDVTTTDGGGDNPDVTTSGNDVVIGTTGILGDANDDGEVDSIDILLVKKYCLQIIDESGLNMTNSDVNRDGFVDVTDLLKIKKFVLTIIDTFD